MFIDNLNVGISRICNKKLIEFFLILMQFLHKILFVVLLCSYLGGIIWTFTYNLSVFEVPGNRFNALTLGCISSPPPPAPAGIMNTTMNTTVPALGMGNTQLPKEVFQFYALDSNAYPNRSFFAITPAMAQSERTLISVNLIWAWILFSGFKFHMTATLDLSVGVYAFEFVLCNVLSAQFRSFAFVSHMDWCSWIQV